MYATCFGSHGFNIDIPYGQFEQKKNLPVYVFFTILTIMRGSNMNASFRMLM